MKVTVDGASLIPQEKNESEKCCQVNPHCENETNKSAEENASKIIVFKA